MVSQIRTLLYCGADIPHEVEVEMALAEGTIPLSGTYLLSQAADFKICCC